MAILPDVELWYAKLDPNRPSARFNKKNPTWELQIRTTDRAVVAQWKEVGLKPKAVIPDEEGAVPYWRVNLRRKSIKADGSPADAPDVIDGQKKPVNPNSIGNASRGNVRVFQYPFTNAENGEKGLATVLMGVQLTKHVVYEAKERDDEFGETETEIVPLSDPDDDDEDFEAITKDPADINLTPKLSKDEDDDEPVVTVAGDDEV